MGQERAPAQVFRPALKQIQSQARIPIMLPSTLPSGISESDIKRAWGEVRKDGYFISLYFAEKGGDSAYAAGFGGSTTIFDLQEIGDERRVALSGGRFGLFRPVSCGGSCAPANLWWQQNGVMYQIQIKFGESDEAQEKILVEMANSLVPAPRE